MSKPNNTNNLTCNANDEHHSSITSILAEMKAQHDRCKHLHIEEERPSCANDDERQASLSDMENESNLTEEHRGIVKDLMGKDRKVIFRKVVQSVNYSKPLLNLVQRYQRKFGIWSIS